MKGAGAFTPAGPPPAPRCRTPVIRAVVPAAYALGALLLAGEAAVHVQQFAAHFYAVRWIGPLFVANAAACLVAIAGLAYPRTRLLTALAGVVISAVALASLVVSSDKGCSAGRNSAFAQPSPSP